METSKPASSRQPVPAPVRLEELLRGRTELLIEHAGAIYRLRLTRNGKLILTK